MHTFETALFCLTIIAAFGCALVAGIFLAFSNFVMKALADVPSSAGIAAMQAINVRVLNPGFLGLFAGTALICIVLACMGVWRWPAPGSGFLVLGSAAYVIGTFLATMKFNVPRNEALARLDASDPQSAIYWRDYVVIWTRWNHVRTIAAIAGAAFFAIAVIQLVT